MQLTASSVASRVPVVLLNGWRLPCIPTDSTISASTGTFGQLASLLQSDGLSVAFFNHCFYGDIPIEDLAAQFGNYLNGLSYTDGTPVSEVDVVAHSMGGLIVRAYLSGKQKTPGLFSPPTNMKIRKFVEIATPNFGSFIAPDIGVQAPEMVPGSQLLWDLATWNQGGDDLRGVDALAIVGNGGPCCTLINPPWQNASDGVVSLTSASLGFARDSSRTRILPYCHTSSSCSGYSGIAYVDSIMHPTWSIVHSFLSGTSDWMSIGTTPTEDQWLSQYGGIFSLWKMRQTSM